MLPSLAAIHDTFTILCDAVLRRRPAFWRRADGHPYRHRFLHRLAVDAALLDGDQKRPTPLALDWLQLPFPDQHQLLADTWASARHAAVRRFSLEYLTALPAGTPLTIAELCTRHSPERQRRLWQPLVWLGFLQPDLDAGELPRFHVAPFPQELPAIPPWQLHGTQVQVLEPYSYADLWALEQIAVLQDLGPPRTYLLHPQHAARQGIPPAAALALLEQATGEALPPAVVRLFAPLPAVLARSGVLLTFADPADLAALSNRRSWRDRFDDILPPSQLFLPAAAARPALRALIRRGFAVDEHLHSAAPPPRSGGSTGEKLRLLFSACVHQEIAGELELPPPYTPAELAALIAALPAGQQRRLQRLVARQVEAFRARLPEPATAPAGEAGSDLPGFLAEAIGTGRWLQLHYQPAPPRPLITRAVIPRSLESWGAHTYLLAYCLHRRALRTFRLDRIRQARPLAVEAIARYDPLRAPAQAPDQADDDTRDDAGPAAHRRAGGRCLQQDIHGQAKQRARDAKHERPEQNGQRDHDQARAPKVSQQSQRQHSRRTNGRDQHQ